MSSGEQAVISVKLHDILSTNNSTFAARFSGVLGELEVPGDECGNQISNGLLSGLMSMPNWP